MTLDDADRASLDDVQLGGWLNPDCRAGSHRACSGDAWSLALDELVPCGCSCHVVVDVAVGGYL